MAILYFTFPSALFAAVFVVPSRIELPCPILISKKRNLHLKVQIHSASQCNLIVLEGPTEFALMLSSVFQAAYLFG